MVSHSTPPVRRRSLVEQVLLYLQQQVADGVFPIGSKLPPEPELMAQLGVGRSTLREAMRALSHMGLVDIRPGDGTYVCAPPPEAEPLGQRLQRARVPEVFEVRHLLELECVRLAALRREQSHLDQLDQALRLRNASRSPEQTEAFVEADMAFHTTIAEASGNAVLADLYRAFIAVHRDAWLKASELPGSKGTQGQYLHEQLAEAIAQHNPLRAQELMAQVLGHSTDRFQEVLYKELT